MNKTLRLIAVGLVSAVAISALAVGLTACDGGSVEGTYVYEIKSKTEISEGGVLHKGFFDAVANSASLKDTLTLNGDNTYVLNKYLDYGDDNTSGEPVHLSYTFYGNYTNSGKKVTLKACTKADYEDATGTALTANGFRATKKSGVTDPKETVGAYDIVLFNTFNSEFLVTAKTCEDQEVELSGSTFKFINKAGGAEDDEELQEDDLGETSANGKSIIDTADGNKMKIHYVSKFNSRLSSDFEIVDTTWAVLQSGEYGKTAEDKVFEVSSTDGAGTLTLMGDGTYTYSWKQGDNGPFGDSGVWTYATYTLTLTATK